MYSSPRLPVFKLVKILVDEFAFRIGAENVIFICGLFTKTPNTGEAGIGYWTYLGTTCGKHSLKQHSYNSDAKAGCSTIFSKIMFLIRKG